MGYTFDYFVAVMECFNCSQVSASDSSTGMQTYLRDDPQLENLGVGSAVGVEFNDMEGKRYIEVSAPSHEVILLDTWNCLRCGHPNWAQITITNGVITDIHAVKFNREIVANATYVLYDAVWLVSDDHTLEPATRADALDALMQSLK